MPFKVAFPFKGKKDALKATAPQSKHFKQKDKRTVAFPKIGQTAIQNKNFTRTYMQRHTMTKIVNRSRSNALERSVKTLRGRGGGGGGGGWGGGNVYIDFTWPQPSPLVLSWYTQDICSVRVKGFQLISATSPRT